MMYADLVDMDDFVTALAGLGIVCLSNEISSVKTSIQNWLQGVDVAKSDSFWDTILRIEAEGILLPEVEQVINWSHRQFSRQ